MIPTRIRAALLLLAAVGCKDKAPEMAQLSDVMPSLPLPPQSRVVSRNASPDALKLTLMSAVKPAQVEACYREVLGRHGWRVLNESRDREGAMVFLAQQDGPPLWVRIKSTDDSVATMVELAGAVSSRAKAGKPSS